MARVGPFLPDSYLFGVGLFAVGALIVEVIEDAEFAENVAFIGWCAFASSLIGALLFSIIHGKLYNNFSFHKFLAELHASRAEKKLIYEGLILSVVVCVLFVYAVTSSSVVGALLSIAAIVSDSSLLVARKAITSGVDGYFAPGYTKQFRDVLIPILLLSSIVINKRFFRSYMFWVPLLSALAAMLISGQRFVLIVLILTLFLGGMYAGFARHTVGYRKKPKKDQIANLALILFIFYGVISFFLGRVEKDASIFGIVGELMWNVLDRILLTVPRENMLTFVLWGKVGPTDGQSWLGELAGILPGVTRVRTLNRL